MKHNELRSNDVEGRRPTARVADNLALAALLLAAIAAAGGLFVPGLYRDTADAVRQAQATDLVTLAAAAPALGLGLWRARSGSAGARLVVIGTLGYLAYSYAIYGFSVVINPLTPAHIAILGLGTWSLILAAVGLDRAILDRATTFRLPRRTVAGFLIAVAALFALLWLGQIAGAIVSGELPAAVSDLNLPTSPVYTLDLAFALPVLVLSGGWLLWRDRRGSASALAALCFLALLGTSVLAIFGVEAAAGVRLELVPIVIFGAVTGVAAAFVVLALVSSPRGPES